MRILRAADYRSMPWKNGGGVTTEVAVSPAGAGLDDFDWRISMARVESSGPFSRFAGVDRTLCVLDGEGLVLDIEDGEPVAVTPAAAPLSFPADARTTAALIGGPITDLNVMTRRGRYAHSVERLLVSEPSEIKTAAGTTLILALGEVTVTGAEQVQLNAFDALLCDDEMCVFLVRPVQATTLFLIRMDRPGNR
jgi:environmental stress-induced protein Ves